MRWPLRPICCGGAEQRGRLLRRVQSATRERRQQPCAEDAEKSQSRRERPQIGADFVQRPEQRRHEQRAVDSRAELVAAPEQNRRRQQCDTGQHVVKRAADREQPHAAIQERDRDEQDDRGEDARRTMHYFPFGRNASSTLPGRLAELAVARADEQHTRAREHRLALDAAAFAFDAVQRREVAQRVVLPDDVAARGIVDVQAAVERAGDDGLVDDERRGR